MLLWFAGVSFAFVWVIFRSPAIDYRLVVLGSIIPLGEAAAGGPLVLHTLLGAVALLVLVMLATRGRRLLRRRLIGLPIGILVHLVLDGVWTEAEVFWWPAFGWGFPGGGLPELGRPVAAVVLMELIGLACLVAMWRRFDLTDPARRRQLLRTGHLPRDLA